MECPFDSVRSSRLAVRLSRNPAQGSSPHLVELQMEWACPVRLGLPGDEILFDQFEMDSSFGSVESDL